jgi:glycosyltransferase involved in cell wall biosynthesis
MRHHLPYGNLRPRLPLENPNRMNPTVSICIPTYNGSAYLADCLNSVISQTYSDFEVLIVDDSSSDDTVAIANAYAKHEPRIRVVANDANRGLVENWNHCVRLSHGDWIKFVFQDDIILPDCLARMLAAGLNSERPVVSCARDFIFENGTPDELRESYLNHKNTIEEVFRHSNQWSAHDFCEAVLTLPTHWNLLGEPTAVLLHRDVFARFGLFNPRFRMLCDYEYWARVASNTGNVHIPEILAMFRVHESSTSAYYRQTPARQYRFEKIDPLLIVHEFAFHPSYAGLRAVAARRRPQINLVNEFWRGALGALWYARRAAKNREHPDASLLEMWHEAARDFPRLGSIPLRARTLSKWSALMKTVSSQSRRLRAARW